jgi:hypothetical protein
VCMTLAARVLARADVCGTGFGVTGTWAKRQRSPQVRHSTPYEIWAHTTTLDARYFFADVERKCYWGWGERVGFYQHSLMGRATDSALHSRPLFRSWRERGFYQLTRN